MSETLAPPDPKAVAADLRVGSADTVDDPDAWRQQALRDAKPTALALNVPPVPPVRPRSDSRGMAVPTPNPAAPKTTDAAPTDPNDPWQSSPMMVSLKGILIPGESGGDPTARNPISGARGTFQFLQSTFVPMMKKNHPEETSGKSDAEIWAMADNPNVNSREAAELAHDNMIQMQKAGVQITPETLAGAHRLGAGGMIAVLKADPNTPMSSIVPAAFSQGGNMDIHDMTAGQFVASPYPGGRGGGGGGDDPTGQNASWQRMQMNFQQAQEAMRQITQDYSKDRDRVRDLASRYKPFEPGPAPRPPEVDPLQSFGGIASIFVALAAGLSKTPAVAAMNGLAGVIDGAREKDWTKYAAEYKTWKDNSEYAYKAHEAYSKDLDEAMNMMTKDVNLGEAMLKATLAIGGDYEKSIQEWRERPLDFQMKQDAAVKARQEMQKRQEDIDDDMQLRGLNGQRDAAREQFTAAQATNDPAKIAEAQKHLTDAEGEVERKLTDIERRKSAQLGYRSRGGTGAGSLNEERLRLTQQYQQDHPDAKPEEIFRWVEERLAEMHPKGGTSVAAKTDAEFESLAREAFTEEFNREPNPNSQIDKNNIIRLKNAAKAEAKLAASPYMQNLNAEQSKVVKAAIRRDPTIADDPVRFGQLINQATGKTEQKEALTGDQIAKIDVHAQRVTHLLDDMGRMRELLSNPGIASKLGRPLRAGESIANILGVMSDTDRAEYDQLQRRVREEGTRLMSAKILPTETKPGADEMAALFPGQRWGDTKQAIDKILDTWEQRFVSDLQLYNQQVPGGLRVLRGTEAEKPPVDGAKKAPDGKWYVPDPARPGKFLQVNP